VLNVFLRAVITGFGLSLGSAIYKRTAKRFGFDDEDPKKEKDKETEKTNQQDGATDPGLQTNFG
jgi:hypothetical protein